MAKVKNIGLIIMLIVLGACTQVDQFWESYDNLPNFTPGCVTTQNGVSAAANAFNNSTEVNYEINCELYAQALELAIDSCGDPSGSFQSTLDNLGDCEYTGGGTPTDCSSAEIAVSTSQQIFAQYSPGQDGYESACTLYRNALLNKIELCGDPSGSIQATVDGLNCSSSSDNAVGYISYATGVVFPNNLTVSEVGGVLHIHAETVSTNYTVDLEIPQGALGDAVDVFTLTTTSGVVNNIWENPDSPFAPFTSNITINNSTTIEGTFYGSLINSSGGVTQLTNGEIAISY